MILVLRIRKVMVKMKKQHYKKTEQLPIRSGFGYRTTAEEVLRNLDLTGRTALVTGGYSGLGLETTRALIQAGAHVIIPARRMDTAEQALYGLRNVEIEEMDLADLTSIQSFSRRILDRNLSIDLAILSAGIMACPETRVGPGWEAHFAINHLGHFALINTLWPAFVADGGARIVSVSSGAHGITPIRWGDVHFEQGYEKFEAYGQSKTANILFAVELDKRGYHQDVRAFSVSPGAILTPLQRHLSKEEMIDLGWIDEHGELADPNFKTPQQGAATQVWAATSPMLDRVGGVYCVDCDITKMAQEGVHDGVKDYAVDSQEAFRLWKLSAELTSVDMPD